MSSPFQHAFSGQDPNLYASITGHSRTRRPSYTLTHPSTRASAFSNLLNPTLQYYTGPGSGPVSGTGVSHVSHHHTPQSPSTSAPFRNHEPEMDQMGPMLDGSSSHPWASRSTPMAPSSRAFGLFLGGAAQATPDPQRPASLFIPSYLKGTVYAEKLESQHKAKQELKESHNLATQSPAGGSTSNGTLGATQNGKQSGSHRGVASSQVEERNTQAPEDSVVGELPTKWNRSDKANVLDILGDGLEAKYVVPKSSSDRDYEAASARADNPVPPQCGIYYYEITILSRKREETTIGLGFASKKASLQRLPGWEGESWGYHGDDGSTFVAQNVGKSYGPRFTTSDTIGCGINFHTGCIFFTKNGVYLGTAFRDVKSVGSLEIYPTIGLKKQGEHLRANFGQSPFVFDIDGTMQSHKSDLWRQVRSTKADNLVPGLDETELIQALVLQYLQHDGYVETARAFAQETHSEKQDLCLNPNVQIEGPSIRDDEDATNRQAIRCAVLEGDIDKALQLTNTHYPEVLAENGQVYFRLRCRKFIEMARRSAELNIRNAPSSKQPATLGQQMELDDDDDDDDDDDEIDQDTLESGSSGMEVSVDSHALLEEMLEYGQALQMEFSGDTNRENQKALQEAFALMAYQNPLKVKEIGHLMDRKGRVAVAEELNSAILMSLGKSRRAPIENMWAQTEVLLERLRPNGEEGAFVSMSDLVDTVSNNRSF